MCESYCFHNLPITVYHPPPPPPPQVVNFSGDCAMFELFLLFLLFVICFHIYLDRFKMNIDMKNRKKTFKLRSMDGIIDYVTGEVSDLSDLSEDNEKSEETAILDHHQTTSDDDIPDDIPDESDVESNTTVEDDIDDEVFLQDVILTENGNVLKMYPFRRRYETKNELSSKGIFTSTNQFRYSFSIRM